MELREVKAVVLKEIEYGESDKLLTLLTDEYGKMTVTAKGVSSFRNRHTNSAKVFAYSSLALKKTKKYFYISDSDLIEAFYEIRYDPVRFALASYLCDVADVLAAEESPDVQLLRLTLNSLYALSVKQKISVDTIKTAFEFRALCDGGYMPMLDRCAGCGEEAAGETVFIDVMNGALLCGKCGKALRQRDVAEDGTAVICPKITRSVLEALRYISLAPIERVFSFNLPEDDLELLNEFTETYLESHFERSLKSLDYYTNIKLDMAGIEY